jgi:hypothetical protein
LDPDHQFHLFLRYLLKDLMDHLDLDHQYRRFHHLGL